MKKFISLFICFLLLLTITPCICATEAESDLNTLSLPDGNTYPVYEISQSDTVYNKTAERVVIPENILSIDDNTFSDCTELKDISIHPNLQYIGNSAFENTAYYNTPDNWKDGVLYIGNCLIKADPAVITDTYTVREGTTLIASGAFKGCEKLSTITLPNSVKYVNKYAFTNTAYYNNPDNWENGVLYLGGILLGISADFTGDLTIKDSVTSIADHAFEHCENLTSVTTPDSLMHIGKSAFIGCIALSSVHLGKAIETLGTGCFSWCLNLSQITLSQGNRNFAIYESILYNKDLTQVVCCPPRLSGNITLPETVREILPYAFLCCTKLQSVVLSENLLYIDSFAFSTTHLNSVKLPENLCYIGDYAFLDNDFITEITIPDNVKELGAYAFSESYYLRKATVGKGITSIPYSCFAYCEKLKEVTLTGNNITYISATAFENTVLVNDTSSYDSYGRLILSDRYLIRVAPDIPYCSIPENVICIADSAFAPALEKGVLKTIYIPEHIPDLYQAVFGAPLDGVTIYYAGTTDNFDHISDLDYNKLDLHTKTSHSTESLTVCLAGGFYLFIIVIVIINNTVAKKAKKRGTENDPE